MRDDMKYRYVHLIGFVCIFNIFGSQYAEATGTCVDIRSSSIGFMTLQSLVNHKCLGDDNDDDKATSEMREALKQKNQAEVTPAQRVKTIRTMLVYLRKALDDKSIQLKLPVSKVRNPIFLVREELAKASQQLEARAITPVLEQQHWSWDNGEGKIGDLYDVKKELLSPACTPTTSVSCRAALALAEEVVRYAKLMEWLSQYSAQGQLEQFHDALSILDQQWHQYATAARSQTPIELSINSAVFDYRKDKNGFVAPPDYQFIVLHPSVALEYVSGAAAGSRFEPAIVMEWFGYNAWSWQTTDGVQMKRPIGVSIVSSFTDRAGTKGTGNGLMFHYNHIYSLGITRHSHDTGMFFSVDLQKLLMDKATQLKDVKTKFNINQ